MTGLRMAAALTPISARNRAMEKVEAYCYGVELFASKAALAKELDKRLGAIITRHSHQMAQIDKYSAMSDYIEAHLSDFAEAHSLKEQAAALASEDWGD